MSEDVPNENTNDENVRGGAGGEDSEDVAEARDSGSADGSVDEVGGSSGAERPRLSRITNPCSSSLMLMGESLDPQQPSPPVNLPQAKEIIDILSMLEEKTKGNLSSEEASVLGDMLYTLRMKYVSATSGVSS